MRSGDWKLTLKEKSEDEHKASQPHTEASAGDDELQTIPMCFRQTSDEEDEVIMNGEEDGDAVNGEEDGSSFLPSLSPKERILKEKKKIECNGKDNRKQPYGSVFTF